MTHTRTSRGTRPCALPRRCDAADSDIPDATGPGFKHCTRRIEAPKASALPHPTFHDAAPAWRATRRWAGSRRVYNGR